MVEGICKGPGIGRVTISILSAKSQTRQSQLSMNDAAPNQRSAGLIVQQGGVLERHGACGVRTREF
jgi:hypothetical protein